MIPWGKCAPPTRPPPSSPSALFGRKAPYEGGRARGRPPPHPRGARLPCNTVRTVQPIRTILITLRYPGKTALPPPAPRPPFSVRPRSLYERDRPEKRGRPPPRPRGARLPCNTVRTVQPIRTILITLQYPAIPAERRRQGGRGGGWAVGIARVQN